MCREARFSFLIVILVGTTASKCPQSRKPHPTNCTMFYNCVDLPGGGYVWAPSKCSEGLVFESYLRMCVLPSETWTCDLLSQPNVIRKKHEAELIKSYLDYNSDPLNLSEMVDSSFSLDSTSAEEINEETTPYSSNEEIFLNLKTENENKEFTKRKTANSIDDKSISEKDHFHHFHLYPRLENKTLLISSVTWLGPIIDNLLIYQSMKILSGETLLETNSGFKSEYPTKNAMNKEDALLNHFITNYIIRNNVGNESLNNEIGAVKEATKYQKLETTTSQIRVESTSVLNQQINGPESIIAVKNNLGKKQYLTIEKYEFLKDQLNPESVDIIPCSSGIRLRNNTDCTKYYICEANTATLREFSCPIYTGFNEKARICDTQTYSLCKKIKKENVEFSLDEETENSRLLEKSLCEAVGKIADPSSASHYYLCYSNNGKTTNIESVRMMCPNNLIFCAEKKVCATKHFCAKRHSE